METESPRDVDQEGALVEANANSANQRAKAITLRTFLALAFLQGAANSWLSQQTDACRFVSLLCLGVGSILITYWFVLDAQEQKFRISKAMILMLVACSLLAAPVYFYRTRGNKTLSAIGRALLFWLLTVIVFCLGIGASYIGTLLFTTGQPSP
jgi:hypothetical protein